MADISAGRHAPLPAAASGMGRFIRMLARCVMIASIWGGPGSIWLGWRLRAIGRELASLPKEASAECDRLRAETDRLFALAVVREAEISEAAQRAALAQGGSALIAWYRSFAWGQIVYGACVPGLILVIGLLLHRGF